MTQKPELTRQCAADVKRIVKEKITEHKIGGQ